MARNIERPDGTAEQAYDPADAVPKTGAALTDYRDEPGYAIRLPDVPAGR